MHAFPSLRTRIESTWTALRNWLAARITGKLSCISLDFMTFIFHTLQLCWARFLFVVVVVDKVMSVILIRVYNTFHFTLRIKNFVEFSTFISEMNHKRHPDSGLEANEANKEKVKKKMCNHARMLLEYSSTVEYAEQTIWFSKVLQSLGMMVMMCAGDECPKPIHLCHWKIYNPMPKIPKWFSSLCARSLVWSFRDAKYEQDELLDNFVQ